MDLSEEEISIHHLLTISNQILASFESIKDLNDASTDTELNKRIFFDVYSLTIIQTCSFIEEYDGFFKSENEIIKQKLRDFKSIFKPAMTRIRNWKDLFNFRNQYLAHNYRDRKKVSIAFKSIDSFDVPNTFPEYFILVGCIRFINEGIRKNFRYEHLPNQIAPSSKETKNVEVIDPIKELELIRNEISKNQINCKNQG